MEQEIKISILNANKIVRKETGELIVKVSYMTKLEQTENFVGYTVLDAWCNGTSFEKLIPLIGKESVAVISLRSKNSSLSAYIKKINNIEI